ncbi:MAG: hypothetical protein PHX02_06560 [Oscillospiraceae bacterium]|jgi:hypothetical protein|nr:hypothetical protein [Oscillospiraceae bacterium]
MDGTVYNDNFVDHLRRFVGETVTIFTTSGGQSGDGFTGVILAVNNCFVRLITRIGPAPGCALGNACNSYGRGGYGNDYNYGNGGCKCNKYDGGYGGRDFYGKNNIVGSVTDIPIDRIASFVHNAV